MQERPLKSSFLYSFWKQVVVLKCLDVVTHMVKHSGDFLRKRLTTEFLPGAVDFLKEHRVTFSKNQSRFTQVHKALNRLVSFLGDVLIDLDVGLKEFCEVTNSCIHFTNCRLHQSVQKVRNFIDAFVIPLKSIILFAVNNGVIQKYRIFL